MGKSVFAEQGVKMTAESERFGKSLFRRFPLWQKNATYRAEGEADELAYYLEVAVPSENPAVAEPLRISTYPFILTVVWAGAIVEWYRPKAEEYSKKAVLFLEDLFTEKIVVGSFGKREHVPSGSFWYRVSWNDDTPHFASRRPQLKPGDVLQERSWRGLYDAMIQGEE